MSVSNFNSTQDKSYIKKLKWLTTQYSITKDRLKLN